MFFTPCVWRTLVLHCVSPTVVAYTQNPTTTTTLLFQLYSAQISNRLTLYSLLYSPLYFIYRDKFNYQYSSCPTSPHPTHPIHPWPSCPPVFTMDASHQLQPRWCLKPGALVREPGNRSSSEGEGRWGRRWKLLSARLAPDGIHRRASKGVWLTRGSLRITAPPDWSGEETREPGRGRKPPTWMERAIGEQKWVGKHSGGMGDSLES